MLLIRHRDCPAAYVTPTEVQLLPRIGALEVDHPDRRWVVCLAFFAQDVLAGRQRAPYTVHRAEHFARCALMPEPQFAAVAGEGDVVLAECFNVPLEQVRERR